MCPLKDPSPTKAARQQTIGKSFSLSGLGLHSGRVTQVSFSPAPANAGLYFLRQGKKIPALVSQVRQTKRGTTLGELAVVEHVLAAAYGLGLDNLQIAVNGEELPVLDGSALPYVEALLAAGIVEQPAEKDFLRLERPLEVSAGEAFLSARPANGFKVEFMVDFPAVGRQQAVFDRQGLSFQVEIAPARTFGFLEEYELLKKQCLGQGASTENALVLTKDGYLNQPRFPDELVRHKILDLIGDLALLGRPVLAEIRAVKSGHKLNVELVRRLLANGGT